MSDEQTKFPGLEEAGDPAEAPVGIRADIRRHEPGVRWDDRRRRPGERRAKTDRRDGDRRRNPDRRTEGGDRRRKDEPFPPPDRRQISTRRLTESRRRTEDRRVGDRRKTPDRRKGGDAERGGASPAKAAPRGLKPAGDRRKPGEDHKD
jgi:hypothetical protein